MRALILLFWFLPACSFAQAGRNYLRDLDSLVLILEKTPSFREQVTGEKRKVFDDLAAQLRKDTTSITSSYDAFCALTLLFGQLRDNHLGFFQVPDQVLHRKFWTDSVAVRQYRSSPAFVRYPRVRMNLDSLEKKLVKAPLDQLEGIYHYGSYLTVGLFRTHPKFGIWKGVVLRTSLPAWERGQVAIQLFSRDSGRYQAIYGHPVFKALIQYPNEAYVNRSLAGSHFYGSVSDDVYRKQPDKPDHSRLAANTPPFLFRRLTPDVGYLRIGHFSAASSDQKTAEAFLKTLPDSLHISRLLVDLRDNQGGAEKVARPFFRLLEEYAKERPVSVLLNYGTMSQGEIFALWLKELPNVRLLGQTTQGTLTYGSNYGRTVLLPGKTARVYITDMKSKYLPYESVGVHPDVELQADQDWLEAGVRELTTRP